MVELLFYGKNTLSAVLAHRQKTYEKKIRSLAENVVLNTPLEDLVASLEDEYTVEPIQLQEDGIRTRRKDAMIPAHDPSINANQVPGTIVYYHIPFAGDASLFRYTPSTFSCSPPRGHLSGNTLILEYPCRNVDAQKIDNEFQSELKQIRSAIGYQDKELKRYNDNLAGNIRAHLSIRLGKLENDQDALSQLGYPALDEDQQEPKTSVPVSKKKKRIVLSKIPSSGAALPMYLPFRTSRNEFLRRQAGAGLAA